MQRGIIDIPQTSAQGFARQWLDITLQDLRDDYIKSPREAFASQDKWVDLSHIGNQLKQSGSDLRSGKFGQGLENAWKAGSKSKLTKMIPVVGTGLSLASRVGLEGQQWDNALVQEAGSTLGASAGFAAGAVAGSALGPVGTVVGGLVGGFAGAIGGDIGTGWAYSKLPGQQDWGYKNRGEQTPKTAESMAFDSQRMEVQRLKEEEEREKRLREQFPNATSQLDTYSLLDRYLQR